ncbi:uncharacterized protein LOC106521631, partial [Austrofundulus limnaeus]|uniref:Uncharacterized protein LOC106521631 n=1 Tax=Austrofundulus limnaeus TaxID=52670 RepID=A0A2I4BPQ1_AUSLI
MDLTEGLSAGTLVTTDNFFTSPRLAERLAGERGVYLLGTMRANRAPRDLPRALLLNADATRYAFKRDVCVVSYARRGAKKKNVLLLTSAPELMRTDHDDDDKPLALRRYNATKGGVDNLDKVTAAYSVRRRTLRWPMALFHNILDVSAYNAFVVWRELRPDWLPGKRDRRRRFMEQLGLELTEAARGGREEQRDPPPRPPRPRVDDKRRPRCSV